LDNIRLIHGSVASEVLPFEAEQKALGFKMNGYISNANYSAKKMALLLFINRKSFFTI
jgi:DNA mismatch repair protein MLH1